MGNEIPMAEYARFHSFSPFEDWRAEYVEARKAYTKARWGTIVKAKLRAILDSLCRLTRTV